jgi:hypothetical protein
MTFTVRARNKLQARPQQKLAILINKKIIIVSLSTIVVVRKPFSIFKKTMTMASKGQNSIQSSLHINLLYTNFD